MKRQLATALLLLFCLTACGDAAKPNPNDPIRLTMWHNFGGEMQETMDYLIDQFNSTEGKRQRIVVDVTAISSSADLNESLAMIAAGDPGAPDMPDIFTGYPRIATWFQEKDLLCNLDGYFSKNELSTYVDDFVAEGRLSDGGLYVFPLAKSTEVLYLNQTLFDRFATDTGADAAQLKTFEGLCSLSRQYYNWTDAKTPDIPNDGKQFYAADAWFHVAEVGAAQLGESLFDGAGGISLTCDAYAHIFDTFYAPAAEGGIAVFDGYSSDLSKTGDIVCSTGSSAGILFYGDTITYADSTTEQVEYSILPYPVLLGGKPIALQRGGGLMVAKSEPKKEAAAAAFLKWLTAPAQNIKFISETGYLPVTKQSLSTDMTEHLNTVQDERIHKMLTAVLDMYKSYTFFAEPSFSSLENDSNAYETKLFSLLTDARESYLAGSPLSAADARAKMMH